MNKTEILMRIHQLENEIKLLRNMLREKKDG
jgi:hypothetical protein